MSGSRTAYEQKKQDWRWKRREEKSWNPTDKNELARERKGEETEYKKKLKEIEEYIEASEKSMWERERGEGWKKKKKC